MWLSGLRAAVQYALGPLVGNRRPTPDSAQKRASDGGVGVGISATHDCVNYCLLQILGMQELPQGVSECRQDPTLLVDIVGGWCFGGAFDRIEKAPIHLYIFRPRYDLPIQTSGIAALADRMSNRHREK